MDRRPSALKRSPSCPGGTSPPYSGAAAYRRARRTSSSPGTPPCAGSHEVEPPESVRSDGGPLASVEAIGITPARDAIRGVSHDRRNVRSVPLDSLASSYG